MNPQKISFADGPLTSEEKAKIYDDMQRKESAPSARSQSESYQFFVQQVSELGNPYDVTRIPISVLRQMERDPMLEFGLHFSRVPIMRARWHIKCERADIAAFVDRSLRRILPALITQYARSWNYGFSPIVKRFSLEKPDWKYNDPAISDEEIPVWDKGPVKAMVWKTFVPLPCDPSLVNPRWSSSGEFNGIRYNSGNLPLPFQALEVDDGNTRDIPLTHSLWATNEKHTGANGSLWGYPRVGYAYRYWWSYWFRMALYDRFFERKADPPYVVYYPSGKGSDYTDDDAGNQTSMKSIALSMGDLARGGGTLAFPGDTIRGYEDRPTSIREWQIEELEVKGDMSHFVETFEYLDVMKLRALLVPEQAFLEGKGGTSSRNVASEEIDIHKEGTALRSDEIDEHINRYVIPDIVAANFPEFEGECLKETTGFNDADISTLDRVLELIGQTDASALSNVDVREVLDRMGMPLVSKAEIKRQEEAIKEELENSNPVPVEQVPGESAGVNEQGLYVQPREIIKLAETNDDFVLSLPKSRHFEDKTVVKTAKKIRSSWVKTYSAAYEDFAEYVSKLEDDELTLSEKTDSEKLANKIVDGWKFSEDKFKLVLDDTNDNIKKVIERAAERELKRSNLSTEDWNPDSELVATFLEDRAGIYVKAIDETTRNELKTFLANQIRDGIENTEIANRIREHFADFPDWKADRLVKTEIRDAYNFATLSAGEAAGIKIVQTVDAQLGEENSDPECIERNGKFFKIKDALAEVLSEHPNGTIEVRLTKRDDLSTKYVDDAEDLATFDEENDTIIFHKDITLDQRQEYLLQLGAILEHE